MSATTPAPRWPDSRTRRLDSAIVAALLLLGMFVPVSFGNERLFNGPAYIISTMVLGLLIFRQHRSPSLPLAMGALLILPLLALFSFTTGFHTTTIGEFAQFLTLALLYMVTLRSIQFPGWLSRLYLIVNIFNIAVGVAILAGSDLVRQVLVNFYSQGYPELVPSMLAWRKPVLTFGTHSVAGFFLYIFFYLNWQTYKIKAKKVYLAVALCNVALTLALLSVTGLLLGCLASAQLLYGLWSSRKRRWLWASAVAIAMAVLLMFAWDPIVQNGSAAFEGARAILTSPGNGFLGRFSPTGTMYWDMRYVIDHPFAPVGLSVNTELLIADMGLLDYFIRGSFILVIWMYGGLFLFLKRNLVAKRDLYFLFFAIVAFELGYSVLPHSRMPFLLAFFVVYLNGLRRFQEEHAMPSRS